MKKRERFLSMMILVFVFSLLFAGTRKVSASSMGDPKEIEVIQFIEDNRPITKTIYLGTKQEIESLTENVTQVIQTDGVNVTGIRIPNGKEKAKVELSFPDGIYYAIDVSLGADVVHGQEVRLKNNFSVNGVVYSLIDSKAETTSPSTLYTDAVTIRKKSSTVKVTGNGADLKNPENKNITGKFAVYLSEPFPVNTRNYMLKFDKTVFEVTNIGRSSSQLTIQGKPKKTAIILFPESTADEEEDGRITFQFEPLKAREMRIRTTAPVGQERIGAAITPDTLETTRVLTLTLEKEIPNLEVGHLIFADNDNNEKMEIQEMTKVESDRGGKAVYKLRIKAKQGGKVNLDEILNGMTSHVFSFQTGETHLPVTLKAEEVQVETTKFEAKPGDTTEALELHFNKAVYDLTKEKIMFDTPDVAEITEVKPLDDTFTKYLIQLEVKKAGKLTLEAINAYDEYTFMFSGEKPSVEVKKYEFVLPYFPDPVTETEKGEKGEKKAEESENKEDIKKTDEVEKAENPLEGSTVLSVKKGKDLSIWIREEELKEALEKEDTVLIRNKKQKIEFSAETLKEIFSEGEKLKLLLRQTKAVVHSGLKTKHNKVYDFKINGTNRKLEKAVKLTLNFGGTKRPKIYSITKGGKLIAIKGVALNKKAKTISFMTKSVRRFVVAY